MTFLSEKESFQGYCRKRIQQSFVETTKSRKRSHIPKVEKTLQYKSLIIDQLSEIPPDSLINWSEIGRKCNIPGKNKGQIAKEIALMSGFNIDDKEKPRKKSTCKSKAKFAGKEVSLPTVPTVNEIKNEIHGMLQNIVLLLGEKCCPYTLVKHRIVNGEIEATETIIHGRKVCLADLRQKLLHKHEHLMRLLPDEKIYTLSRNELEVMIRDDVSDISDGDLRLKLKSYQRTRNIAVWHDHSNIVGQGYILMTFHVLYDPTVFFTVDEYNAINTDNKIASIQQFIEEPEVYMLCLSSSSPSDQLATIADRIYCLRHLTKC